MQTLRSGVVHTIPADMRSVLRSTPVLTELWNSLTPLARNEWICWVTTPKKPETRMKHLVRLGEDLVRGKRRPCCWSGCTHRK